MSTVSEPQSRRIWMACFFSAAALQLGGTFAIELGEYHPAPIAYRFNSESPIISSICGQVALLRTVNANVHLIQRIDPVAAGHAMRDTRARHESKVLLDRARVVCSELLSLD